MNSYSEANLEVYKRAKSKSVNPDLLVGLDSNMEFDKVLLIFTKKHNKL